MKNTYICKCGRIVRKSTDADNTGNRDTAQCTGCPYLLPYGEQEYIKGEGFHLKVKGYECRVSQSLEYASRFVGCTSDMGVCSVVSLDYEFMTQIGRWIRETYPDGELNGGFSPKNVRPTDFSNKGRYRYAITCAHNKKGMAAKAALLERFFNPDGSRKDMTPEEEERKIKDLIENGKRAAQGAATEPMQAPEARTPAGASDTTEVLTTVANALPAFDYSGLDAETATHLQNLARRALESKQRYYLDMMEIVYKAHRELVQPLHKRGNQYSESTFVLWCASIGVSRSAAYNLLHVQALMDNSTPEEQETLEKLPAKAIYEIARPSTPAEVVTAAKSGDITTLKEYKELMDQLKAEQAAREAAEKKARDVQADAEEAYAAAHRYHVEKEEAEAQRDALIDRETEMANLCVEAQTAQRHAEQERDSVRNMLKNTQRRTERLEIEHNDTVAHLESIRAELNALQSRPIEVAVAEPDPAEIERLATEKAEDIAAQRTAALQAQLDKLQQEAQANRAQNAEDLKIQDYDTVLFAISVIQNAWKSAGPSFRRLDDQCRAQLRRNLMERIAEIEKAVNVC